MRSAIATNNPTRATRLQGSATPRHLSARGSIGQAFDIRIAPQSTRRLGCGDRGYAPNPRKASRGNRGRRHKSGISGVLMDFLCVRTTFAIARLRITEIGWRANRNGGAHAASEYARRYTRRPGSGGESGDGQRARVAVCLWIARRVVASAAVHRAWARRDRMRRVRCRAGRCMRQLRPRLATLRGATPVSFWTRATWSGGVRAADWDRRVAGGLEAAAPKSDAAKSRSGFHALA
jgi:hypothetical protein